MTAARARDHSGVPLRVGQRVVFTGTVMAGELTATGIRSAAIAAGTPGVVTAVRPHGQGWQVDVAVGSRVVFIGAHHLHVGVRA